MKMNAMPVLRIMFVVFLAVIFLPRPAPAGVPLAIGGESRDVPTLAPLLERVTPGVVNIAVRGQVAVQQNPLFEDPFFRRFFDFPQQPRNREFQAAGSGVIVDADKGYVLTNNHVVEHAKELTVTLRDGRELNAEVVGTDPEADVAVIKVPAENLTAVPLGDSSRLKVGDFVIAVGNPFGLGQTVTFGIVSALGRSGLGIEGYEDFIQTDASINPGNSGGALVNLKGELVGINTAIVGPGGGNVGIGFAIPINMARAIMAQLIEHGAMRRGQLGVHIQDMNPDLAEAMGVDATGGVLIAQVLPNSPAAKAGLEAGDVIVAMDGEPIRDADELRNRIGMSEVGESVLLDVRRKGQRLEVTATLVARSGAKMQARDIDPRLEGAVFGAIDESSPLYGQVDGVQALEVQPGSPAAGNGLRKGDVITAVNHHTVHDVAELEQFAGANERVLLLNVRRGDDSLFIAIQ
jgi:serine protease Do/serine protease DegQ